MLKVNLACLRRVALHCVATAQPATHPRSMMPFHPAAPISVLFPCPHSFSSWSSFDAYPVSLPQCKIVSSHERCIHCCAALAKVPLAGSPGGREARQEGQQLPTAAMHVFSWALGALMAKLETAPSPRPYWPKKVDKWRQLGQSGGLPNREATHAYRLSNHLQTSLQICRTLQVSYTNALACPLPNALPSRLSQSIH